MTHAISIKNLTKQYQSGHKALDDVSLDVKKGEIFALLGPNGAGKTTLISAVCGVLRISSGHVSVFGHDNQSDYRNARSHVGLVPQELVHTPFETVWNCVTFSRGLFGKPPNSDYIETLLKDLSLWDKKDSQIRELSGGMKRRVMIAKALSYEPDILFLDEPTAGVDVELRKSMWRLVRKLRDTGVTIILTTHYLEEAEEMADRIGVINKGKIVLIEDKVTLMKTLGTKECVLHLDQPLSSLPKALSKFDAVLNDEGTTMTLTYDPNKYDGAIEHFMSALKNSGVRYKDLDTRQSSLEDIFVQLVGDDA